MHPRSFQSFQWLKGLFPCCLIALCLPSAAIAQVGELLWEENFNELDTELWNINVGDGCPNLCGWGNQELEWYSENNVRIEPVPNEPGNSALVLEARRENVDIRGFTSGKIDSQNGVTIQYGMIETRIRVPDLDLGLWPAFWMLGTSTATWPANGEIDIMEMGHKRSVIDDFAPGADINSHMGSNLIFFADAACSPENPTCAASLAFSSDTAFVADTPMNDRFVTYRLYWTDTSIRFSIIDNGVEFDILEQPFVISEESAEFREPFYLLMNLAVGGNFTDAAVDSEVTAPMPAKMFIDYIRVHEYNGMGSVTLGNPVEPEFGTFGVFTDETPTNNKLVTGESSDVFIWNTDALVQGSEAPFEGDNVISWDVVAPGSWFGAGIQARQPVDLSNFAEGNLKFRIKVPADVSFQIGVLDTFTNEHWIQFPANQDQFGLVRNGDWGQVTIPISELRGELVALQSISNPFAILSMDGDLPAGNFSIAIDDVVWEGGGTPPNDSDGDGVSDDQDLCPGTPQGANVDQDGCEVNTDSDGDGVSDANDLCPGTPQGASVDEFGCEAVPLETVQVEAEDYVDFFDTDAGNNGGAFRNDDVDIEATTDTGGGYNVGWTADGEWLEYSVILNEGSYDLSARVASLNGGGGYTLSVNGQALASSSVGATGGWQSWETQNLGSFSTAGGTLTLRVDIDTGGFNLNWLRLEQTSTEPADSDGDGVPDDSDQCPNTAPGDAVDSNGCTLAEPAEPVQVEAESYTGFFDTDAGNNGGAFRNDDVDIEATTDTGGGYNVGWTAAGEWLEYSLDLAQGSYQLTARAASLNGGGSYSVSLDGQQIGSAQVDATGGWQSWVTQDLGQFSASGGPATLRVDIQSGGFNLNWLHLEPVTDDGNNTDGGNQDATSGAVQLDSTSLEFFVNTTDWADVHFTVNGGTQQNIRMIQDGTANTHLLEGLNAGDRVDYSFTYWDVTNAMAVESDPATHIMQ